MRSFLPWLRLSSLLELPDAATVARQNYRGVIVEASQAAGDESLQILEEFCAKLRAHQLQWAIDLSSFAPSDQELLRKDLKFENHEPNFIPSSQARCDFLHPRSGESLCEFLSQLSSRPDAVYFSLQRASQSEGNYPPFPWTETLPPAFREQFGYELASELECLISSGEKAARFRQHFWQCVARLHAENCLQPLQEFCDTNKYNFSAQHWKWEWATLEPSELFLARLNQMSGGEKQTYPVCLSGDLEEAIGCLAAGCASSQRKAEHTNLTSRREMHLNESLARGAQLNAETFAAAQVGVLFPARSAMTHYHPDGHRFTRWVAEDLKVVTQMLDDLHVAWAFLDEGDWAGAARDLEMVVLAGASALSRKTWDDLMGYGRDGGKVACLGLLPRWSENGRDREFEIRVGKDTMVVAEDIFQAYDALDGNGDMPPTIGYPVFNELEGGGRICVYQPRLNFDSDDALLRVRQIIHESFVPSVQTQCKEIATNYRRDEKSGDDWFFIANKADEKQDFNIRLNGKKRGGCQSKILRLTKHDVWNDISKAVAVWMEYSADEGGGLSAALSLAPLQAAWLQVGSPKSQEDSARIERSTFPITQAGEYSVSGYATHSHDLAIAVRKGEKLKWYRAAAQALPMPVFLEETSWGEQEKDGYIEYLQLLSVERKWESCQVFLELVAPKESVNVLLNGIQIGERWTPPLRFDVTDALRFGDINKIVLRVFDKEATSKSAPPARLVAYPKILIEWDEYE